MSGNRRETRNGGDNSLVGRTLYIPRMSVEGPAATAALFRSFGVNGQLTPESDAHTLELARQETVGEECYPQIVTLGGFMTVLNSPDFDPDRTAFMMPTANGPCRFGQYKQVVERVLRERGIDGVMLVSPSSSNGYEGFGDHGSNLIRLLWWAVVCSDGLRKLLLQTRPYETVPGETDRVHGECLDLLCGVLERPDLSDKEKFAALVDVMTEMVRRFDAIPARYTPDKPLVGVVGEIYCRLDDFANAYLIRRIEKFGGEAWLASISEWVNFTNFIQRHHLTVEGQRWTKKMFAAYVKSTIQLRDEHQLLAPLHDRSVGYDEPESIFSMVKPAEPYLPYWGAYGEMVLNVGGAIFLYEQGGDGVIDISPFTCMNGIVCEAVYPRVSKDHDGFPIRNFYFDESGTDYDRDVEIFLELADTYRRRKTKRRRFPAHFETAATVSARAEV